MSTPQQPPKRRRIAGEAKPGEAPTQASDFTEVAEEVTRPKLAKPKLPKRTKSEPAAEPAVEASAPPPPPPSAPDLPAAPPRAESVRVPRAKPSGLVIGLLVVAIASLAFGCIGAWHGVNQWRADNLATSREAAADAAASAAETIFTYQYNQLDQHLEAAEKVMTPTFAKEFRTGEKALAQLAPQRKIRVKAVVRNAATVECGESCSPERAKVLVFIDQARVADNVDKPTVFGNRIRVSMVNRDGKWLVNDIETL